MKITPKMFLALCALLLLFSCSKKETPTGPENTDQFESSISGKIVDKAGNPLSGVAISSQKSGTSVLTDASGKFTLADLASGEHKIDIFKKDYADTSLTVTLNLLEKQVLPADFRLRYAYATIIGTVTRNGAPAMGAGVTVRNQSVSIIADNIGSFRLERVLPGTVEVVALLAGFGLKEMNLVSDSVYSISIPVDKFGGTVTGTVVDATGNPIVNASVVAVKGVAEVTTNSKGEFTLENVPDGTNIVVTGSGTESDKSTVLGDVSVSENGFAVVDTVKLGKTSVVNPADSLALYPMKYSLATTASDYVFTAVPMVLPKTYTVEKYLWYLTDSLSSPAITTLPQLSQSNTLYKTAGTYTAWVKVVAVKKTVVGDTLIVDSIVSKLTPITIKVTGNAVLDTISAIFLSPASLKSPTDIVDVNISNLKDTITTLHLGISGATIDSAWLPVADSKTMILTYTNVVDMSMLTGAKPLTGTKTVVRLKLSKMVAGTPVLLVGVEADKLGKPVSFTKVNGAVVK